MYVVDMHCDSLMLAERGEPLVKSYNVSGSGRYLQFFAHFSSTGSGDAARRREHLMENHARWLSESRRHSLCVIRTAKELSEAVRLGKSASLFSVEGGGGIMPHSPELSALFEGGLRVFGPVWDENELGAAAWSQEDFGLTAAGREVLAEVLALGIIPDVSHMSDRGFWQLSQMTDKPFIATHSNFRSVCASPRNLTLEMALEIRRRGGVIGLNIYPPFLSDTGSADSDDIIRHVDYALEKLGEDTLAFGFDIDGTDGMYPRGFNESESMHDRVCELLALRYGERVAEKISGKNVLSFLEANLPR